MNLYDKLPGLLSHSGRVVERISSEAMNSWGQDSHFGLCASLRSPMMQNQPDPIAQPVLNTPYEHSARETRLVSETLLVYNTKQRCLIG